MSLLIELQTFLTEKRFLNLSRRGLITEIVGIGSSLETPSGLMVQFLYRGLMDHSNNLLMQVGRWLRKEIKQSMSVLNHLSK